jgi:hypothetical protein
LFTKSRRISLFVAIFVILVFSTCAFAHVKLTLKAPSDVNLDAAGFTLALYQGTGNTTMVTSIDMSNATQRVYSLPYPGTYNYRVTSTPGALYYGVTKLLHFTQNQVDDQYAIELQVQSGLRPTGTETFGPASVSIFTEQINDNLFGTVGVLKGFPADGLKTPAFTTTKNKFQVTTQADLMKFLTDLVSANPKAHLFSLANATDKVTNKPFGKTPTLGYDMPIVIVSNSSIPANATFEQAAKIIRENGKATFLHQASIHGDEESPAEGALAMLLEVVGSYGTKYLEKVDFVCLPRFNVEGAARWTRSSIVPVIDMNRDHLRLRAPEVRMAHTAYLELLPEVIMDGHEIGYFTVPSTTTNSAVAYATGGITDLEATPSTSMNNPSLALNDLALDTYGYNLHTQLGDAKLRTNHYENAQNGWTSNHAIGRAYYGLMGSVSMLVEVRGTGSLQMARRAYAHVLASKSLLETLYDNDVQTKALVKQARENIIAKGKT